MGLEFWFCLFGWFFVCLGFWLGWVGLGFIGFIGVWGFFFGWFVFFSLIRYTELFTRVGILGGLKMVDF